MAEAMTAGAVPVVARVGDLADLVVNGINGYTVEPNQIDEYSKKIMMVLQDDFILEKYSVKASEIAGKYTSIEVVTEKWRRFYENCLSQAPCLMK